MENLSSPPRPVLLACALLKNITMPKTNIPRKVHFITYRDELFKVSCEVLLQEACDIGWFETVRDPNDILPELREKYSSILQKQRRGGFWVWKPLIIQHALSAMREAAAGGPVHSLAEAPLRLPTTYMPLSPFFFVSMSCVVMLL